MFNIDYKTATWAGLITAPVFLFLEMIMVPVFLNGSPWAPPRMMAAFFLGGEVAPLPSTFDLKIFMAAMLVHFSLSIRIMFIGVFVIDKMSFVIAVIVGNLWGLLLYWIGFYLMTDIWPGLKKRRIGCPL